MANKLKVGDRVGYMATAGSPSGEVAYGTITTFLPSGDPERDAVVVLDDESQTERAVLVADIVQHSRPGESRRWRWFVIDLCTLEHILKHAGHCWFRLEVEGGDGLPEDARIVGDVQADWNSRGVRVRYEHESFAVVPNGGETPCGGCLTLRVKKEAAS